MRLIFLGLLGILLCLPLQAEELLPQVQKELRARKFYFGEIDGRASQETTAAVKRFQLAKGMDATGNLDGETLRALGFKVPLDPKAAEERQTLESCSKFVLQYLQARETGRWEEIAPFFGDPVDFYFDQAVARDSLRSKLAGAKAPPSPRQNIMLNRVASLVPGSSDIVQVTVRVQTRVSPVSEGQPRVETEDLLFRLRRPKDDGWKITVLKLLE